MPQNGNKSFKKRKGRFRIFNSTSLPLLFDLIYLIPFNENYEIYMAKTSKKLNFQT